MALDDPRHVAVVGGDEDVACSGDHEIESRQLCRSILERPELVFCQNILLSQLQRGKKGNEQRKFYKRGSEGGYDVGKRAVDGGHSLLSAVGVPGGDVYLGFPVDSKCLEN